MTTTPGDQFDDTPHGVGFDTDGVPFILEAAIPPAPDFTGCLWPVLPSCASDVQEWANLDEDVKTRSLALASSTLEMLTAHRVKGCPITIRPCRSLCGCERPVCGSCRGGSEITLPFVGGLVEVRVDGEAQALSDFRVDDQTTIVFQGAGQSPFAGPQDLSKPLGEPGTWSITFYDAMPVDQLGAMSAMTLALEFSKACEGDGQCRLPSGVRTIVRFGATYDIQPGMFPDGFTSIESIDAYIEIWNPGGGRGQPVGVWSPDIQDFRVV